MSLLTILSGSVSRNSLRSARKNIILASATTLTNLKPESTLNSEPDAKTIITRKKYEELPVVKKYPDGSIASALDDWPGGLQTSRALLEAEARGRINENEMPSVFAEEYQEPPRKRQKTQSKQEINASSLTGERNAASYGEAVSSPKRARGRSRARLETKNIASHVGGVEPTDPIANIDKRALPPVYSKAVDKVEDNQSQGSWNLLSDVHDISELPVKLRRKLKSAAKEAKLPPNVDTARPKVSRSRKAVEVGKSISDGEQRVPQNQLAIEILENLARFSHCILLTRVGNFYESYFDQAAEVAQLLSIKLTKRTWDRMEVLMCGFPIIHLDKHLKVLLLTHKRCVAMCEEFKRRHPEEGFERRVVRVLTPGTLIDEPFLNLYENNYLLAVGSLSSILKSGSNEESQAAPNRTHSQENLGLAWIDVSTGEFFTQQSTVASFKDDLARIGPREVVLHTSLKEKASHPIFLSAVEEGCFVSYASPDDTYSLPASSDKTTAIASVDDPRKTAPFSPSKSLLTDHESLAINLLTTFMQANLLEHMPLLSSPTRQGIQDRMQMDSHTIKALEIRESMREGGATGSLMSAVKRTVTTSGTRLLSRWLCSPSISVTEIRARQNLVSLFRSRHHLRDDLTVMLKRIEDATRIVQRFLLGKGDVEDLSAIKNAIEIWGEIRSRVEMERKLESRNVATNDDEEWAELDGMLNRMADLRGLAQRIGMAIVDNNENQSAEENDVADTPADEVPKPLLSDDPTEASKEGTHKWSIRPDFSPELLSLHARLKKVKSDVQRLEEELRRRFNAPSLTLRSSGIHGIHVHIGKSRRDLAVIERSPHFIPIASTSSTKSFFNQTWYMLGTEIMNIILEISAAEKSAFEALRQDVNIESGPLRRNARMVDELDVTIGFANLASEMNFVRPIVNESTSYKVTNGRHPTVELGLLTSGRVFTPNTVSLTPESRLHIITGPNMAGKSTLLRQTALLAVLAQTGSFVPADKAELGIVDKMFSRVGAKDDLFRDRSTFMVEMLETAEILNSATERSLVIMDEVGRGTTMKDGLAIAFATICHLYDVNQCRTLFATHFHEVADFLGFVEDSLPPAAFNGINFFCTDVDKTEDGHFAYSHRLRPGVNRDSHGLKVAQIAGMPPSSMRIAHDTLNWMKARQSVADREQLRSAGQMILRERIRNPMEASDTVSGLEGTDY